MTIEKLERKTCTLIEYYAHTGGFSVIGEPHKRVCEGLYTMTTYTLANKGGYRAYIVATLWDSDNDWNISVYNPQRKGKAIFSIGNKKEEA